MAKPKLICLDRDGTIIRDENYYLGSSPNWRRQIEFLPEVIRGIRLLDTLKDSYIFILTNQSGVALLGGNFDSLTEERMHEVNKYILRRLNALGAHVRGYFACPYVSSDYSEKAKRKGRIVDPKYIDDNCEDLKPRIGMIKKAAESLGMTYKKMDVFVVGDRISDLELALNGGGIGILVPSEKTIELGDMKKAKEMMSANPHKILIVRSFFNAASLIETF